MTSFSDISKTLPQFSKYLHEPTANDCVKKMARKEHGKPLVKFVKKALELQIWQTNPQLKSLIDCAFEKKDRLSKKLKQELKTLKNIFQSHLINLAEKQVIEDPKNQKLKYDLAKLYMNEETYIPALSLLESTRKDIEASEDSSVSAKKVKRKISKCEKKVDSETKAIDKQVKKVEFIKGYVENFSKNKIGKHLAKILKTNKELLPIEASFLRLYTSNFYKMINMHLRGGSELATYLRKKHVGTKEQDGVISFIKKSIPIIAHSLKKMPSLKALYPQETLYDKIGRTVFRGMAVPTEYIKDLQKKDTLTNPGFLSASTDMSTAIHFAKRTSGKEPLLFMITDEKGTGVPIDKLSHTKDEKEVLFCPNTDLHIQSISKTRKDPFRGIPYDIWVVKATT